MGNFKSYDSGEQADSIMLLTMKCTRLTSKSEKSQLLVLYPEATHFPLSSPYSLLATYRAVSPAPVAAQLGRDRVSCSWEGLLILQTWWQIMETKTQFPWEDLARCQGPRGTSRALTCITSYLDRGHTSARKKQFSAEDPRVPHLYIHQYPGFLKKVYGYRK